MGKLSDNAASQLAKTIVNADKYKPPVVNYGTIVESGGNKYVKIDGSTYETPFISLTDTRPDERVTVEVINHQVIVKGNMTNPAIGKKTVEETVNRIDNDMDDLEEDYNNKIDETNYNLEELRKEAEKERKRIEDELNAAKEDLGTRVDAAQADADQAGIDAEAARHEAVDFIEKQSDGFYVGTTAYPEYHVRIYSGGIEIRKGYTSPIVLSHWDASELVVGQSNKFHSRIGVNQMSLRGPKSASDSTIVDYVTLKTDGLTVGRPNTFRSTFNIDGMHCYDASNNEYAKYLTTGFTLGYTDANKINLYGTNTALQFRKGTEVLTEYALNQILLGPTSGTNKNILINQNGIVLRQGTTNLANFTANEINLGTNASTSVIKLCGSKGNISYGTTSIDTILDDGPSQVTGLNLASEGSLLLTPKNDFSMLVKAGGEIGGIEAYKANDGHINVGIGTKRSGGEAYLFLGYNPNYPYKCDYILAAARSVELSGYQWVWNRGSGLDTDGSPGYVVYGFNYIDLRGSFRSQTVSNSTTRIYTDTLHTPPGGTSDIWLNASSQFWVKSPTVEFSNLSTFYASSPYVEFANCGHFWINNTDLTVAPAASTASLYEAQVQQSKAIVSLYENQLAQSEAITALYESTL